MLNMTHESSFKKLLGLEFFKFAVDNKCLTWRLMSTLLIVRDFLLNFTLTNFTSLFQRNFSKGKDSQR